MSAYVYNTATSANGFIADEANSLAWLFEVQGTDGDLSADFMAGVGIQVMGSTTYEWLLREENLLEEPHKWAGFFGPLATRVFSSRDLPIPDGADVRILRGSVADHIDSLQAAAGDKDVWIVGGGDLAGQFLDAGHLDRIELTVAPAFLAGGAPLLPRRIPSARLRLVATEQRGPFARLVFEVSA